MMILAHLTSEPHMALSAALVLFFAGLGAGVCIGLAIARKLVRGAR